MGFAKRLILGVLTAAFVAAIVGCFLSVTTRPVYRLPKCTAWSWLCCWGGSVHLSRMVRVDPNTGRREGTEEWEADWPLLWEPPNPRSPVLGFYWHQAPFVTVNGRPVTQNERVDIPLWAPLLVFGAYPCVAAIRGVRRVWRIKRGLCVTCAYNLTGNFAGICPECGDQIAYPRIAGKGLG
jgi:hypothetical protein